MKVKDILLIGSSHAAALKQGFDLVDNDISMDVIAAPKRVSKNLNIKGTIIRFKGNKKRLEYIHKSFGNLRPCDASQYKKIIIAQGQPVLRLDHYINRRNKNVPRLSENIVKDIITSRFKNHWITALAENCLSSRIIYVGSPPPSEKVNLGPFKLLSNHENHENIGHLRRAIANVIQDCENKIRIKLYTPPIQVMSENLFTVKHKYFQGRDVPYGGSDDLRHCNAEYGKIVFKDLLNC